MPITGTFQADFESFYVAVTQAEAKLRSFEAGSKSVEKQLNSMVDQFSGRKVIQDATLMTEAVERIGGAAKLTEAELARVGRTVNEAADKMRAMGMEIPNGMLRIADATKGVGAAADYSKNLLAAMTAQAAAMFSAGAMLSMAKQALDAGSEIKKMAEQTGFAYSEVQKLQGIATASGSSVQSLVSASQSLTLALGDDSSGAAGAVKALGLNLDEFRTLRPYDQMVTLAEKIQGIKDPTEQARVAADAFGRSWKEILPALISGMKQTGDAVLQMSDAQVQALAAADTQFQKLKNSLIVGIGAIVGAIEQAGYNVGAKWQAITNPDLKGYTPENLAAIYGRENDPNSFLGALSTVPKLANPAIAALAELGQANKGLITDKTKLAEVEADLAKKAAAAIEANKKAAAEQKKRDDDAAAAAKVLTAALDELNSVGDSWRGTVEQMDQGTRGLVEAYLAAGVSAKTLQAIFPVTETQLRAITKAMSEQTQEAKRMAAALNEGAKLQAELDALRVSESGSALDQQIADINRWADTYEARLRQAGTLTVENSNLIRSIEKARVDEALIDRKALDEASRLTLEDNAKVAERTYQEALAHSDRYTYEAIENFRLQADAARDAATLWGTSFQQAGDEASDAVRRATDSMALSWSDAMSKVNAGLGEMRTNIELALPRNFDWVGAYEAAGLVQTSTMPGGYPSGMDPRLARREGLGTTVGGVQMRASGGPVVAAHPYVVGERGPELFVPGSSGSIQPSAAASVMNNVFHINGTGQEIARVVAAELTRQMRVGRKWPSV